ncbi:MAG: hypothetical protein ACE5EX_00330 [Phycisphaerae bacterium]
MVMRNAKRKRWMNLLTASSLTLGGVLYAATERVSVVSSGGASDQGGGWVHNVGQPIIGVAGGGGTVEVRMGALHILAFARIGPVLGDCTGNGVVDREDHRVFVDCMSGPHGGVATGCGCADIDADDDVDLDDAGNLARRFAPAG